MDKIGLLYNLRKLHGYLHERLFFLKIELLTILCKKKNLVVATSFRGKMYGDNPKYIIEKIHEFSPDTEIVWLGRSDIKDVPEFVRIVNVKDEKSIVRELATAKVILGNSHCFNCLRLNLNQIHIETWHGGLGIKKIGNDVAKRKKKCSRSGYDFYLSNSDFLTKIYRSAFNFNGLVWKSGYPIEDELFVEINQKSVIRKRYSVPENVQIALYAPTFRDEYRWKSKMDVDNIIKAFEKSFGGRWVLFVHWHPNSLQEDRVLAGAIDATETCSMQDLVNASDAFITDYSSAIFQAVQCKIPCFVYADDYDKFNENRGVYLTFDELPFPYAFDEAKLVDDILHYDASYWNYQWKIFAKSMGHVVSGHAADDVAKVCVDFLNGMTKAEVMGRIPFETTI